MLVVYRLRKKSLRKHFVQVVQVQHAIGGGQLCVCIMMRQLSTNENAE